MHGLCVCWMVLVAVGPAANAACSGPAASRPAAEDGVDRILETLERRGDTVEDLSCNLTLEIDDKVVFEKQTKHGKLLFRRERPSALFRVDFHKLIEGDGVVKHRGHAEWHIFDGHWYTEARESTRTVIKRRIVREGETFDPFEVGSSPFPLPFGQKKADILKNFAVELVPPAKGDPPESDHLKCVPRAGSRYADDYSELHFHISREKELPVRVVTHQKKERKTLTATFKRIETNKAPARSRMLREFPKDWTHTIEE